jgi:hypothetical protein
LETAPLFLPKRAAWRAGLATEEGMSPFRIVWEEGTDPSASLPGSRSASSRIEAHGRRRSACLTRSRLLDAGHVVALCDNQNYLKRQ